jgi:hypothetical protein
MVIVLEYLTNRRDIGKKIVIISLCRSLHMID